MTQTKKQICNCLLYSYCIANINTFEMRLKAIIKKAIKICQNKNKFLTRKFSQQCGHLGNGGELWIIQYHRQCQAVPPDATHCKDDVNKNMASNATEENVSENENKSEPTPSSSQNENNEPNNPNFECNICLDTAKEAVVSMCGHLFW